MSYADLIQLYFERSAAIQSYWTIYVVVIGGLLAFASLRKEPDFTTTALISVLYLCFAYKNLGAIEDASLQRIALRQSIALATSEPGTASDGAAAVPSPAGETPTASGAAAIRRLIEPTLNPPDIGGIKSFHLSSDLLTLAALWAMELRRRRMRSAAM